MQLSVSALDCEAAMIRGADRLNAAFANAIDGIGVMAYAFLLFLRATLGGSPGVMAGDHDIGRVRLLLLGVEGIASMATASPDTQLSDALLRERDHIGHAAGAQVTHRWDDAESLVPVSAFETPAELPHQRHQAFDNLIHLFALMHQGHSQCHTLAFADDRQRRVSVKTCRACSGLVGTDILVFGAILAVIGDIDPIASRFPGPR